MDTALAQLHDRLSALEQENAVLRYLLAQQSCSRLQSCEQESLQLGVSNASEHRLLEAAVTVTSALLTVSNFDAAVNAALQIIGEVLDADRVNVIENFDHPSDSSFPYWRVLAYEWNSLGTVSQFADPGAAQGSYEEIQWLYELGQQGKAASYLIEEAPEPFRSAQVAIGVKSTHIVPIFVEGQWWGVLGIDDCRDAKRRSRAELAVLKIAADCIGSAIQRDRTQKALLQAEQARSAELEKVNEALQQRDHLLSTVAAVSKDLLESAEVEGAIDQALQQIGEAAGISRVTLMQEKREASSKRLHHHVIQEWAAPNVPKQMNDPATRKVSNDDYGVLLNELRAGRSIWHTLEDLPEPARLQQAGIGVKSTGAVPIFIEGEYFGCVGFDDCGTYRQWTPHEVDVLTSGASAIGAALHRKQLVDRLIAERIQVEQARSAELEKVNKALKRTVDVLAMETDLARFLGQVLRVIADQLEAPLVEYWYHLEPANLAYVGLTYWQGQILKPEEQPGHVGSFGYPVPAAMIQQESLHHRRSHFITEDMVTSPLHSQIAHESGLDAGAWYGSRGVSSLLNVPLLLGDKTIGALVVFFPRSRPFTEQQIELTYVLAQQVTLAVQLTRLAEEAKQTAIFEERNRMASEIHDTLAQAFTGISLQLEVSKSLVHADSQAVQQILNHISQLAKTGLTEARRSVWALYPPASEYADLAQLLYDNVEQMTRNTSIAVEVNVQGTPYSLQPFIGMNLLRIGQEALTNALKHAQAQTIAINLAYESDRILLTIYDNGRGFTPPTTIGNLNGGFGLMGMYERCNRIGAQLSLTSQPGQGTQILVEAPIG